MRKMTTLSIMETMREHSPKLVDQAALVSQELIRVSILWQELWAESLEEASRLYFGEHNVEGMLACLAPLHEMMQAGPHTVREEDFERTFGRELQQAHEWCKKYQGSKREQDLNQAWDLYYQVFRRVSKQLQQLTRHELRNVSPRLLEAKNLDLAVPGTYQPGHPIVAIASFSPTIQVITSKQRPRKITIKGCDGKDYMFLLKGHEDLRQDERVMQLLGLVNTLLAADPETSTKSLEVPRYAVIPLAPNSGLIGWVPHSDTMHALIREYREQRKILLNIETRLMGQMAPDYDNLCLIQKVEVFKYALSNTTGTDLYKVLWLKSPSSEVWLDRRCNFTRSLATMSMIGYILGLGDRHPCNLMIDRLSGKIIHIDFGDCFEVAMNRDKFPERIPFRLTRMLVNAMEASKIEGNFRMTCNEVMQVLWDNQQSVMAMLEAFVYDPLINWRLLNTKISGETTTGNKPGSQSKPVNTASATAARPPPQINKLAAPEDPLDGHGMDDLSKSLRVHRTEGEVLKSIVTHTGGIPATDAINQRAAAVIGRVQKKLTGRDFVSENGRVINVGEQVQRLIQQATSHENLCQCYTGWCPFW